MTTADSQRRNWVVIALALVIVFVGVLLRFVEIRRLAYGTTKS